jgi:outer membrane lipoprotein-sorting protein/peroxiredoxin
MFLLRSWPAVLLSALAFAQQPAPDARALLKASANALRVMKSYEIDQNVVVEMKGGLNRRIEMPVKLSVSKPGRVRIESSTELGSTLIVSDGANTWMYVGPLNQYTKTAAVSNPDALMKTMNPGAAQTMDEEKPRDPYTSVKVGGEEIIEVAGRKYSCWVLEATLAKIDAPAQMTVGDGTAKIWIDKATKLTLKQVTAGTLEGGPLRNSTQMNQSSTVQALHLNEPIADSTFTFTPPEGAQLVADFTGPVKATPDLNGKSAAKFDLKAHDGQTYSLETLRGKVVVLNFWATWCEPCRAELPLFEKLRQEFAAKGLAVLGINSSEDPATVRKFLEQAKLTYPMLLGADSGIEEDYRVTAYPTVVLIDREGTIVLYHVGTGSEQELRENLARLGLAATPGK